MPRFEPFSGLRYDPTRVRLAEVISPPYDVISPEEQARLQARSPYNSVRVELPGAGPGLDPYHASAQRFADWQDEGVLRLDPAPTFYGYRMAYVDPAGHERETIGVIGALGLEPPGTGGIFPHERTTPKAKSDRLNLLQATRVNTSPIWGLSLASGLSQLLEHSGERGEAVTDDDGIVHQLWPIADDAVAARISRAVSAAPVVIADGHHRFETALNYQREREATESVVGGPAPYDAVMALVVELVEDQLSVQAIHRLVHGLSADFDVAAAMARFFDLEATDAQGPALLEQMAATDSVGLLTASGVWLLRPTPETIAAAGHDLDSSRVEVAFDTLPDHEVIYEPSLQVASDAVTSGRAQAALLLRPVSVEQIASTGRGGERMPPKTTFFWPKPRTGFVFRPLDR